MRHLVHSALVTIILMTSIAANAQNPSKPMSNSEQLSELTRMPEYIVFGLKTVVATTSDEAWKIRVTQCLDTSVLDRARAAYREVIDSLLSQDETTAALAFLTSAVGRKYLFRMHADIPFDGSKPRPTNEGRLTKKQQEAADTFLKSRAGQLVFLIAAESKAPVNKATKDAYLECLK